MSSTSLSFLNPKMSDELRDAGYSTNMQRYFFHVRVGNVVYEDHEGAELSDLDAAVSHAINDARNILRDDPDRGREGWMEVADSQGIIIRTVRFETVGP